MKRSRRNQLRIRRSTRRWQRSQANRCCRGRKRTVVASEAAADAGGHGSRSRGRRAAADAVAAEAAPEAVAEPELVEVWRPGGRSEERRPRVMIATVIAITIAPPKARSLRRRRGRAGEAGEAAKRERHRRGRRDRHSDFRKPRPDAPAEGARRACGARARRRANRARTRRPSAARAFSGQGHGDNDKDQTDKGKFRGDRDKAAGATRVAATRAAVATRAAGTAAPRTGNMPPAPPRASAIVRSIPIRRLPNWRRSRNSSPPTARTAKRFQRMEPVR